MSNDDIVDGTFEEITEDAEINEQDLIVENPPYQPTKDEALAALNKAIKNGDIHSSLAARLRSQMGIFKSSFTKKQIDDKKRKVLRKKQKAARKKQRK